MKTDQLKPKRCPIACTSLVRAAPRWKVSTFTCQNSVSANCCHISLLVLETAKSREVFHSKYFQIVTYNLYW